MDSNKILEGDLSSTWMDPRPIGHWCCKCSDVVQKGNISPGLNTTVFKAEKYVIKAGIMENIGKDYTGRNIYNLTAKQPLRLLIFPR